MNKMLKIANINKYMTAIKIANLIRTATYTTVAVLTIFNFYKVYKAVVK